jgi:hypothetical protein
MSLADGMPAGSFGSHGPPDAGGAGGGPCQLQGVSDGPAWIQTSLQIVGKAAPVGEPVGEPGEHVYLDTVKVDHVRPLS